MTNVAGNVSEVFTDRMHQGTIERAALGRIHNIGDLYNARSDTFCAASIFRNKCPKDAITRTDNVSSKISVAMNSSLQEKMSKLDIAGELKVSVLAGLFKLEGSGKYLTNNKASYKSVECSLLYHVTTVVERLNLFHASLKPCISHEAICHDDATHVVVGVDWGASCALTLKDENADNADVKEIQGMLQGTLEKIAVVVTDRSAKGSFDYMSSDKNTCSKFSLELFGDILPEESDEMPLDVQSALQIIRKMPALTKMYNEGKGRPLKYILYPLSNKQIREHLGISGSANIVLHQLDEAAISRVVQLFDHLTGTTQKITDKIDDITGNRSCYADDAVEATRSLKDEVEVLESEFRQKLAKTLIEIRAGSTSSTELESLRQKYKKEVDSLHQKFDEVYESGRAKMNFAKCCNAKDGLTQIAVKELSNARLRYRHVYVLFANVESEEYTNDHVRVTKSFFDLMEKRKNPSNTAFYYTWSDPKSVTRIEYYKDGAMHTGKHGKQ